MHTAENLMQHAFFVQWTHLKQYNDRYSVVAYLLTIGKINCLKNIRSQKFQGKKKKKIVEVLLFTNMAEEKADKALQYRLQKFLGELPEKQKQVLLKHVPNIRPYLKPPMNYMLPGRRLCMIRYSFFLNFLNSLENMLTNDRTKFFHNNQLCFGSIFQR